MNKQDSDWPDFDHGITRRKFIGAAAGGSAALLPGGLTSLLKPTVSAAGFDFIEATSPQLQAAMASGALTSAGLTMGYINRIQSLNPTLHAVIELNPNAVAILLLLITSAVQEMCVALCMAFRFLLKTTSPRRTTC